MENIVAGIVIGVIILVVMLFMAWRTQKKREKEFHEFEAETKEMFRDKGMLLHHRDDPYTGLVLRSNRVPRREAPIQQPTPQSSSEEDFSNGVLAGIVAAELMSSHQHTEASPMEKPFEGGGGSMGAAGASGGWDAPSEDRSSADTKSEEQPSDSTSSDSGGNSDSND